MVRHLFFISWFIFLIFVFNQALSQNTYPKYYIKKVAGAPKPLDTTAASNYTLGIASSPTLSWSQLSFTKKGDLIFFSPEKSTINKLDTNGNVIRIAGNGNYGFGDNGMPAKMRPFPSFVNGITTDNNDNVVFSEFGVIYKIDNNGTIIKIAGGASDNYTDFQKKAINTNLSTARYLNSDLEGNLYFILNREKVIKLTKDGDLKEILGNSAPENERADSISISPRGKMAFDKTGNLYFTERNLIRKISKEGVITTIAGIKTHYGFSGDSVLAKNSLLQNPGSICIDNDDNIYVNESNRIRKIDKNGIITTVAGNGKYGHSGDNGPAINASIGSIYGMITDKSGNLYFTSQFTNSSGRIGYVIRKINNGIITTIAGNETSGFSGDGGNAILAQLNAPRGLALNNDGELLIADVNNRRIRKVTKDGKIFTYAGNGNSFFGNEGTKALNTSMAPGDLYFDSSNNKIYFSDIQNYRIRTIDKDSIVKTFAGNGNQGSSSDGLLALNSTIKADWITSDKNNNLFFIDNSYKIKKISDTTKTITTFAGNGYSSSCLDGNKNKCQFLSTLYQYAIDKKGNTFFWVRDENKIKKLSSAGIITTIAGNGEKGFSGDGTIATNAKIDVGTFALDTTGNIFFTDPSSYRIRKINVNSGIITTVAGNGTSIFAGNIVTASDQISLKNPNCISFDNSNCGYFYEDNYLRKLSTNGIISTIAGNGLNPYNSPIDYNTKSSVKTTLLGSIRGIWVDSSDNIYYSDLDNHFIRKISDGMISNLYGTGSSIELDGNAKLAGIPSPTNIIFDKSGNAYTLILGGGAAKIKKITNSTGVISTLAGTGATETTENLAINAKFSSLSLSISIDTSQNIIVFDHNKIRKITNDGKIKTIAGPPPPSSNIGFAGDGDLATNSLLNGPYDINSLIINKANNDIIFTDTYNNRIRKITNSTGLINTIAGSATEGYGGDGGKAINAQLLYPSNISMDSKSNIYFFQSSSIGTILRKIDTLGNISTVIAASGKINTGIDGYEANEYTIDASSFFISPKDEMYFFDGGTNTINKIFSSSKNILPPKNINLTIDRNNIKLNWDNSNQLNQIFKIYRNSTNSLDEKILIEDECRSKYYSDSIMLKLKEVYKNPIIKYWVRAFDTTEGILSDFSLEKNLLLPPSFDSIKSGNKINTLNWNYIAADSIKYFKIYRDTIFNPTTLLDSITASKTSYIDSNKLILNKKYYYRIVAGINPLTESPFSDTISAIPFNINPIAEKLENRSFVNTGEFNFKKTSISSMKSFDRDGKIISKKWYLNGKLINSTDSTLSYDFPQGTSELKLIVEDNDGAKDSSTCRIDVLAFAKNFNGGIKSGISAASKNAIYIADSTYDLNSGGAIYKLDRLGNTDLKLSVNFKVLNTPSVSFDSSVLVTSGSNLNGFNKNGGPLWPTIPLGSTTNVTPTVDTLYNRIYIGVTNKNFFAFDIKTGKLNWMYTCESPIISSAVITGNRRLVFISQSGILYGFDISKDTSSMNPKWKYNLGDTVTKSVAVDLENNIYFGTIKGSLLKIKLNSDSTISKVWTTQLTDSIESSPVIDSKGFVYIGTNKGKLYKLNPLDGKIIWSFNTGNAIKSTPAITNFGTIVFANMKGEIYSLDTTMNLRWKYQSNAPISANLLYVENMIYAGNDSGSYFGIYDNPKTSTVSSENNSLGNNIENQKNQTLQNFNTQSNIVESLTNAEPIWGTFQGNYRRTGFQSVDCPEKPTITSSKNQFSFCEGDSITLTTPQNNDKIFWYSKSGNIKQISSNSITIKKAEEIFLSRTNSYGCTVASDTISIKTFSIPTAPAIIRDGTGNLISNTQIGTITWYKENIKVSDSANTYKPNTNGYYSAKLTINGCVSPMSANYYYIISSIINLNNYKNIKIIPNPTRDYIKLIANYNTNKIFSLVFHSSDGKFVMKINKISNGDNIDLTKLGKGQYIVSVFEGDIFTGNNIKLMKY